MSLCERTPEEEAVLAVVKDTLNCHVAGGWVRDKLRGREPKDMDVWLVGGSAQSVEKLIDDIFCMAVNNDLPFCKKVGVYQFSEDVSGEGRVEEYAQVSVGALIVDIIVPFESSVTELLNGFDFDVNQIALSYTQGVELILSAASTFHDIVAGVAKRTRPEETDKDANRTERMRELGFTVIDEVTPCPEKDSNIPF